MGDLFHWSLRRDEIAKVLGVVDDHILQAKANGREPSVFMFLTKRAERMREVVTWWLRDFRDAGLELDLRYLWFGVTAENQERADERIPYLLEMPVPVRFVSLEPLLGPINLERLKLNGGKWWDALSGLQYWAPGAAPIKGSLSWVIAGAETGPGARPMEIPWAFDLMAECEGAGVPFFFKRDSKGQTRLGGRIWDEFPKPK
jgi:protein gp37